MGNPAAVSRTLFLILLFAPAGNADAQDRRENPRDHAVEFAGLLAGEHSYLLDPADRERVDELLRTMREAQAGLREAAEATPKAQAAESLARAGRELADLLERRPDVRRLSLTENGLEPPVLGPIGMVGDTGALLLRIDQGPGGLWFSSYELEQAVPESRKNIWIDVAPAGVTWVLLGLHTLPVGRTTIRIEFLRPGRPNVAGLLEVDVPPSGRLRLTPLWDETGAPGPAMIRITSLATGRDRPPADAVDMSPQFDGNGRSSHRRTANVPGPLSGRWWCVAGPVDMTLPPGEYEVVVRRGIEHLPVTERFTVRSGEQTVLTCRLKRWIDMPARGWYSGDDHVHGRILGDADAARLMAWLKAEDVHVGNIVKMGDISRTYFEQRGFGPAFRVRDGDYVLAPGQECPRTHNELGHTLALNITAMVRDTARYYLYDLVADTVHAQGGLWGYAHVNSGIFHVHRDMSINVPKDKCDFAEVLQFGQLGTDLWYAFLNLGFRITASAGSDVPWGGTIGEVRLYAFTGAGFDPDAWFEAVRRGRTFVTNGPLIEFTVNDALPGDEIAVEDDARLRVRARVTGRPGYSPPEILKVVRFGEDLQTAAATGPGQDELSLDFEVRAGHGCWLAAVARGADGTHAHTTPVYVRRRGLRSWKYEDVPALLAARRESLGQIETLVAAARTADPQALAGHQELRQLALQAEPLLERVRAARAIYDELEKTAERERPLRTGP